jgi:guanylate kinase
MENNNIGRLFIVTAPSGAGKTSLVKALLKLCPQIQISISHTTRYPREDEKDGVDYFFVNNEIFENLKNNGEFLENAECHGAKYGTAKTPVDSTLKSGKDIILEIDYQGALIVKNIFKEAISIFIIPPSMEILKQRLVARGQNSIVEINGRLTAAKEEIRHLEKFDYVIINENFDKALDNLKSIYDDSDESKKLVTANQKEIFQNVINSIK